jgi:hypothetical protein
VCLFCALLGVQVYFIVVCFLGCAVQCVFVRTGSWMGPPAAFQALPCSQLQAARKQCHAPDLTHAWPTRESSSRSVIGLNDRRKAAHRQEIELGRHPRSHAGGVPTTAHRHPSWTQGKLCLTLHGILMCLQQALKRLQFALVFQGRCCGVVWCRVVLCCVVSCRVALRWVVLCCVVVSCCLGLSCCASN